MEEYKRYLEEAQKWILEPTLDEDVKKEWQLPPKWKMIAQMPFGSIETMAEEKTFLPIDKMVMIKK